MAFFWGGGLLAVGGALVAIAGRGAALATIAGGGDLDAPSVAIMLNHGLLSSDDFVAYDPARGWWFLNLGRNFVYPTEALYHALAFLAIVRSVRRQTFGALVFAGMTAACSPFAGMQVLAILGLWSILRLLAGPDRGAPVRQFAEWIVLVAAFLGYYVLFLGRFPEHSTLASAMALNWRYSGSTFALAYGPVLAVAAWRIRSVDRFRQVTASDHGRMLLAWGIASLLLENHDFLVAPRQPIHFTRGYAWSAFFLLGAPSLVGWLDRLPRWGRSLLMAVILSDNAFWFAGIASEVGMPDRNGLRLTSESREVLDRLGRDDLRDRLLISEDERISYLAIAETRLRSWVGHPLETPHYVERKREVEDFFRAGRSAPGWKGRSLVVVAYRRGEPGIRSSGLDRAGVFRAIWDNRKFRILVADPGRTVRRDRDDPRTR